ncbi:MAG: formylglycine-generating enzyme family protein [Alphaproteobacteria bacterium]|nr:formylglycine-generating enzyme family protein [Alphaproteobacteria bacterium]MBU0863329.1 formylglycine-generating enzyme family protein [Alphaproteobacteria bacterium]MBU1825030.1 formylglycine-generating enzyme family protein [Alphaproteobacteria bacterium]
MKTHLAILAALGLGACSAETADMAGAKGANECADCPEMIAIPGGTFEMGETVDYGYGEMDGPRHDVTVPGFALAKYEVTRGEYGRFIADSGYVPERKCNAYKEDTKWYIDPERSWDAPGFEQKDDEPVVCISWNDTQAYIGWLNQKTGQNYRLPSEAEWEYVAVGGGLGASGQITHDEANIGKEKCCGGLASGKDRWVYPAPVGSFPADRFGLHDIRGNVWEWQADCYHVNYDGAPVDGSARAKGCDSPEHRAVRGGSYGDAAEFMRPTFRLPGPRGEGYFTVGFRLASGKASPKAGTR